MSKPLNHLLFDMRGRSLERSLDWQWLTQGLMFSVLHDWSWSCLDGHEMLPSLVPKGPGFSYGPGLGFGALA